MHLKESIRKWTNGDKKMAKQAEEKRKRLEKIRRIGLTPNQNSWLRH